MRHPEDDVCPHSGFHGKSVKHFSAKLVIRPADVLITSFLKGMTLSGSPRPGKYHTSSHLSFCLPGVRCFALYPGHS